MKRLNLGRINPPPPPLAFNQRVFHFTMFLTNIPLQIGIQCEVLEAEQCCAKSFSNSCSLIRPSGVWSISRIKSTISSIDKPAFKWSNPFLNSSTVISPNNNKKKKKKKKAFRTHHILIDDNQEYFSHYYTVVWSSSTA